VLYEISGVIAYDQVYYSLKKTSREAMKASSDLRITLHDVAEKAGVSHQTVSRVINQHPYVKPHTRERVLRAIEELGYLPNRSAKSTREGRSGTLAFVTFHGEAIVPLHRSLLSSEQAANEASYDLLFAAASDHSWNHIRMVLDRLIGWQVDGIIIASTVVSIDYDRIRAHCSPIPVVQRDARTGIKTPSVVSDQDYGTRLAVQHLIDQGHTRICEISGPLDWFAAQTRHAAWQDALQKAGIEPGMSIPGNWSVEAGYQAACTLLAQAGDFTGLIVGNDEMALGAIHALVENGLNIPHDVSIIGYDDIPGAAYFLPPLTTIRPNYEALGREAVKYLIECIEDAQTPPQQRIIYPDLVVRASTAPPSHKR
jgi:DNA-binding LacI/PurR family transcriptional regulator